MLGTKFGEKCIIMHFSELEKDGKVPQRRNAEALRKDWEKIREEETEQKPRAT